MDEDTISWILSVVVTGIVINIASSYIKSGLDQLRSKYSEKRRARFDAKKRMEESEFNLLINSETKRTEKRFHLLHIKSNAIYELLIAIANLSFVHLYKDQNPTLALISSSISIAFLIQSLKTYDSFRKENLKLLDAEIQSYENSNNPNQKSE